MDRQEFRSLRARIRLIPLAGIGVNIAGASLLFVYFSLIEPGTAQAGTWELFRERLTFFFSVFLLMLGLIIPINALWTFYPLSRDMTEAFSPDSRQPHIADRMEYLRDLAARALNLPMRVSIIVFAAWILCGLGFLALARYAPEWFPWDQAAAYKMFLGIVMASAPVSVAFMYFIEERLVRWILSRHFPSEVLEIIPPSVRIGVFTRILAVSILIGTMPVGLTSYEVLRRVHQIRNHLLSVDVFLAQLPLLIIFLLGLSVLVALGLSILMARSFADPLSQVETAMEQVGRGDLNTRVPVVCNDEIGSVSAGFNRMVADYRRLESIRDTFGRYLSPDVVAEILKSPGGVELAGELREITILVSDLRGFTRICESNEARVVVQIINRYLGCMTDIIDRHRGTIDEFTGDGILVFFGAPKRLRDHAERAVACALDMQRAMDGLNREYESLDLPQFQMGIGINTGELVVGNIGSERRKKYGAVGSPINVAFRVESQTSGGEILITTEVLERVGEKVVTGTPRETVLKGLDRMVTLYPVLDFKRSMQ